MKSFTLPRRGLVITLFLAASASAILLDRAGMSDAPDARPAPPAAFGAAPRALASSAWRRALLNGVPPMFDFVHAATMTEYIARGAATGDFNGDGRDDLALVGSDAGDLWIAARVYLLLQSPDGSLAPPVTIELPRPVRGIAVNGIAAGDINKDGRDDLVVAQLEPEPGLFVMLSGAGGEFTWRVDAWNDGYFHSPELSDQDGDGNLDVVAVGGRKLYLHQDPLPGLLAVWFGDGTGGFPRHQSMPACCGAANFSLGQLDGVLGPDILTVTLGDGVPAVVRRVDAAGAWQPALELFPDENDDTTSHFGVGAVYDATGDGRADAVIAQVNPGPRLRVHAQLADGTLSLAPQVYAGGNDGYRAAHADLDGDGREDFIQVGPGPGPAEPGFDYLLRDDYGIDYPVRVSFPDTNPGGYVAQAFAIGDFNGDGVSDVVVASEYDGIAIWHGRLTPFAGAGGLPGAPQVLSAQADPDPVAGAANVTLAPAVDTGGSAITGYTVYATPGGGIDADAGSPALVHRITGLDRGTTYTFHARASNAAGKGPPSAPGASASIPDYPLAVSMYVDSRAEGDVGDTVFLVQPMLSRRAPPGGVSLTLHTQDGTAHAGSDYAALPPTQVTIPEGSRYAELTIAVHGDLGIEGDETFTVVASNVQGAAAPPPCTVTIHNDDKAELRILLGTTFHAEGNAGLKRVYVPVTVTPAQSTDLVLTVAAFGVTAEDEGDFILPLTSLLIPAGQTSAQIAVDLVGDTVFERDEHLGVHATNGPPYSGAPYGFAHLIIEEDDPQPQLSLAGTTATEGDGGERTVWFRATLSGTQPEDAWFALTTADGTAIAGLDYVQTYHSSLVIPAGSTTLDIPVAILGDFADELDEQFSVRLVAPAHVLLGNAEATGSIVDDDAPTGISVTGVTLPEGNAGGVARFTIGLAAAQAGPVSFDVRTRDGTAFVGTDYAAVSNAGLVIPAGQTRLHVDVPILGDSTWEPDETFVLEFGQVNGAVPVQAQALARLVNDDLPAIAIADAALEEGDAPYPAPRTMNFQVTLSAPAPTPVVFWLDIGTDGSADSGSDMQNNFSLPFTIDVGRSAKTVELQVYGDEEVEADESFTLRIASVHGATLGDGVATGTILNDDGAAAVASTRGRPARDRGKSARRALRE